MAKQKFGEMDGWSKFLFIVGWIGIVCGALCLILGIFLATNASMLGSDFLAQYDNTIDGETGEALVQYSAIALIIISVVSIFVAWLDVRGAKDNAKIMPALVFTVIDVVINVVSLASYGASSSYIISLIINIVALVACVKIFQNNKKAA